jgi:hypothetical protein
MKTQTYWIPISSFLLAVVLASVAGPGRRSSAQERSPGRETYLKFAFSDLLIDSFQTGGSSSSDQPPAESVSLNFTKIDFEYKAQDKDGKLPGSPPKLGWDLKKFSAVDRLYIEGVYRNKNNTAQTVTLPVQLDSAQEIADLPGPVLLSATLSFTLDEARRALNASRSQAAQALGISPGDVELVTTLSGGDTFFVQMISEAETLGYDLKATPVVSRFQVTLSPTEDDAVITPL